MDGEKNAQSVITFSTILHRILPIIYKGSWKRHAYDEDTMEVEEYKMGEHIGVLLVYELPDSVREKETEAQAYAAVWDIMMAIQKKLPVAIRQIHLYALLLPVYPAEPVVIPITYMNSLFPQKISFFICEKHRILLSICIEPEQYV